MPRELGQRSACVRRMNVTLARRLVEPRAPGLPAADPAAHAAWQPRQVDAFATPAFTGFAASDEHAAYLVFRGTKLHLDSGDLFRRTMQAWLANLDFAQVEERGAMVHRGYARELDGVERPRCSRWRATTPSAASRSTSPATAPAAPWRRWPRAACTRRARTVRAAVVFSAPRVGDRRFAASYPVPLLRIEHRHDLIPHLPLPPVARPHRSAAASSTR